MGIFHFPENEAADSLGFQAENQGKFRIQELLGVSQEVFVGLVELPACCELGLFVAQQSADHAHQLRPVAGADQLPEPEFALIFVG